MSDNEETGSSEAPLVRTNVTINVTDIFGLGRAAKSDAAKGVVRALEGLLKSVSRPTEIYLTGKAENAVAADAIISSANAKAEAAAVRQASRELMERASQRFVAVEATKQVNLENTIEKAIGIIDQEAPSARQRPIEEGWLLSWLEGAQSASADHLREMWARILAAQAQEDKSAVSKASIALVALLDENLAREFERFVAFLWHYGCVPSDVAVLPFFNPTKLNLLREIGLIDHGMPSELDFRDFKVAFQTGPLALRIPCSVINLTNRGYEIAEAIVGKPVDLARLQVKPPNADEDVAYFRRALEGMIESAKHAPLIITTTPTKNKAVEQTLIVQSVKTEVGTTSPRRQFDWRHFNSPSSRSANEFLARIDEWFIVDGTPSDLNS